MWSYIQLCTIMYSYAPVRRRELDLMIPVGPFQLRYSMIQCQSYPKAIPPAEAPSLSLSGFLPAASLHFQRCAEVNDSAELDVVGGMHTHTHTRISPRAKPCAKALSCCAVWPLGPEERAGQQARRNCLRDSLVWVCWFAKISVWWSSDGFQPGPGDHKAPQDPSRGDISPT